MTLFERIKETAKERGISLTALSVESGLGEKTIYKWKDKEPSASRIKAVADTLGVSVDYLLGNTDEMHSNKKDDMPVDLEEVLDKLGPTLRFEGKELTDEQKIKLYEMAKLMFGE
ncbi:XRE family transcriptional regulator [Weissella confusa]|uniref:helix-turn-helix domain-containing protein n=1 Tax=Weissella confusa TaxID=1583 RepID=UPI001681A550|nr:helix-turn-helix transcriptional regulator [Weissella confusa]MBD1490391.1 XRE family transcriptional regulator [Weissella confusa]MBF7058676.1 helix-turn-helix transcriptional regulator [Weissella confusa]MBJ7621550.1 helix-turn-helix transcriptional regulator [Weissella confusa]MBJ7662392.1 helix-turn-helix transcriptional regulator [Weissella confusa]MBU5284914.1 helix-turn-helix transcriptional regulator [Weissella confusa]